MVISMRWQAVVSCSFLSLSINFFCNHLLADVFMAHSLIYRMSSNITFSVKIIPVTLLKTTTLQPSLQPILFILLHFSNSTSVSSIQLSRSVVSDSLWPHGLQHARPPCPSPIPGVHSNSCPLSRWCHPAISSSVVPFSSCPQSLPESGSFPMSQLFAWGRQSIGVSGLTSVLPKNTQNWSPLEWTCWISLQSKRLSRVFSNTTVQRHQFIGTQLSSQSNSHIHTWPLEKP